MGSLGYVTLDEGINVYSQRKFGISHSRITKNHGETVEFPFVSTDIDITAFGPINLSLNSWFGLVSYIAGTPILGRTSCTKSLTIVYFPVILYPGFHDKCG